tara:strand:- start:1575 stop:2090 length:516 start_codon:yes stop_codon:yes gene_type:complete
MAKRKFDAVSQHLAEDLYDNDVMSLRLSELASERAAVLLTFEDITQDLNSQLSQASAGRKQLLEQKLEYERTLYNDRMSSLEAKYAKQESANKLMNSLKKKRRIIDKELDDCQDIATGGVQKCSWRSIRKVMHIRHNMNTHKSEMTNEQKSKYAKVLTELSEQGFRVVTDS